jgi:two-component system, NtrC family, response regulator AtoC
MQNHLEVREIRPPAACFLPNGNTVVVGLQAAAAKLAELECPLLIVGETGSGRRTLARYIHERSARGSEPFTVHDCEQLSALANNGDFEQHLGMSGVSYLSDACQLSVPAQQKIVGLLRRGEGCPRFIFGEREEAECEPRFRRCTETFCHALGSVCLRLPPLRERREDIPGLAEHFLERYSQAFERPLPQLSVEALEFFLNYRWPGNVAELETAIKSLVAIGDERMIMAALRASVLTGAANDAKPASLKQASRAASLAAERKLIFDVLATTGWNRKRTAQLLQISYKALLYKLKRTGIESSGLERVEEGTGS